MLSRVLRRRDDARPAAPVAPWASYIAQRDADRSLGIARLHFEIEIIDDATAIAGDDDPRMFCGDCRADLWPEPRVAFRRHDRVEPPHCRQRIALCLTLALSALEELEEFGFTLERVFLAHHDRLAGWPPRSRSEVQNVASMTRKYAGDFGLRTLSQLLHGRDL
jgi:hypothetical protein